MPDQEPGSASGDSDTGDLDIAINGLFMQDHEAGEPWSQPVPSWEEPYTAHDGTAQIFSVTTPGLFLDATQLPTVDRIYPGKGSLTGWLKQSAPLPPDSLGPAARVRSRSQLLLIPGERDRLVIWRNYSISVCQLGRDGSLGPVVSPVGVKPLSTPLVTGSIPEGVRYVPELMSVGAGSAFMMRDTATFSHAVPVEAAATFVFSKARKIWPVRSKYPELWSCIMLLEQGFVLAYTLRMDRSDAAHPIFRVAATEQLTATGGNRCVHVRPLPDDKSQVILFDMPEIRTVAMSHFINRIGGYEFLETNSVSAQLPGFRLPNCPPGTTFEMTGAAHGDASQLDIFVQVRRPNMESDVCVTTRTGDGTWRQMLCVERGVRSVSVFPSSGRVKLLIGRAIKSGNQAERMEYEIWERSAQGYWAIDSVQLPKEEARPKPVPTFRIGLKVSRKSVGLPGEEIGITASLPTVADVNGHRTVIPTMEPLRAVTDNMGSVWLVLPLQDRLSFAELQISSPRFAQKLELRPNGALGTYLSSLKATDLTTKPAKGNALLSDPALANDVASAVRSVIAAASQSRTTAATAPQGVRVTTDLPHQWIGESPSASAGGTNRSATEPPPAWSLDRDGSRFRAIPVADAQARIAREINVAVYGHVPGSIPNVTISRSILSDIEDDLNWVGGRLADAVTAIGTAASSVVSFVMDGAKLAIKVIISGIEYVYSGIVDTIHKAMDAIACVLDYAGVKLGQAANWLLEQLGFLFDWDAIKAKRDELRGMVKDNLGVVKQWFPNPTASANTVVDGLSSLRANLTSYRSLSASSTSLSARFSLGAGLPSLSAVGGAGSLPRLNWLTDKIDSALSALTGDAGFGMPQVPGMQEATNALFTTVAEVMDFLPAVLTSFDNAAGQWLDSTASFVDRTATALVDILLDQLDRLISLVQRLVVQAADAIAKLLTHPEAVLAWLDRKISIPFFGAFYFGRNSPGSGGAIKPAGCL